MFAVLAVHAAGVNESVKYFKFGETTYEAAFVPVLSMKTVSCEDWFAPRGGNAITPRCPQLSR